MSDLYESAKKLLSLASKIERASTEEEENRLCDERDALLCKFRKADAALTPPLSARPKVSG